MELLSFAISFLIACFTIPLVIKFYRENNWVDDPQDYQDVKAKMTHSKPIPRGGGIPIFLSFATTSLFFLNIDKYLIAIILGGFILTVVGVADDVFNLNPFLRLGIDFLAILIVVAAGIGIAFVTNPFGTGVIHLNQPQLAFDILGKTRTIWILADLFALFFILWNMNAVNWSKGVDGQLPAFVTFAFLFLGILSNSFSADPTEFNTVALSFILAGSYAGLLVFNWYPQKIMPGYGGGALAGYFLSIIAILSGAKVATTLMVLAVPTADGIFTILRRIRAGKSPFWGDRGHLHHKLLDSFNWDKRQITIFYTLTTMIMGSLALILDTRGKIISLAISFSLVFIIQIWAKIKQIKQYD